MFTLILFLNSSNKRAKVLKFSSFTEFIFFKKFSYSFCLRLEDFKIPRVIHGLSRVLELTLIFIFGKAIS